MGALVTRESFSRADWLRNCLPSATVQSGPNPVGQQGLSSARVSLLLTVKLTAALTARQAPPPAERRQMIALSDRHLVKSLDQPTYLFALRRHDVTDAAKF